MSTKCGLASSEPMDDIMSKDEREAARERCEAATDYHRLDYGEHYNGPHEPPCWDGTIYAVATTTGDSGPGGACTESWVTYDASVTGAAEADAEFDFHARTDLSRALDTIDALEVQLDSANSTLRAWNRLAVEACDPTDDEAVLAAMSRHLDTIDALEAQIDAFSRGRISKWHAEQVTAEMLAAYLDDSDLWVWHEADDDYREHWRIDGNARDRIHPGDAARWAIERIAFKEGRGELAVWCDIVGGEGE